MVQLAYHSLHHSPLMGGAAPVAETIAAAAGAGFEYIGLDRASVTAHEHSGGDVGMISDVLRDHNLQCSDVAVLMTGVDRTDPVAEAEALADLGGVVGAEACLTTQIGPIPEPHLIEVLDECADRLGALGMRLAIEFVPYTPLPDLRASIRVCEALGWDRAGVALDSLHFFRSGAPWAELEALEKEQIALVQYSDAPAAPPDSLRDESSNQRRFPGDGGLELRRFVQAVLATGYDGTVTAEVLSTVVRASDPVAMARKAFSTLQRDWS